ncbi:hypothetical protein [Chitinophaga sp.]|uniref:hypothetical protein n=1 Tax=Chitinophaga sp. TaxID=1869181 RepID=UPI0031D309F3
MEDKTRKEDLMGIFNKDEVFQPYTTPDGWTVILPGEEDGRREKYGRKIVAVTEVEIKLTDENSLNICIRELEESDRRIRERSGGGGWDWRKVLVKDFDVRFGVAWYDRGFFESRKEAWANPEHAKIYEKFGAGIENFKVNHQLVEESYK